MRFFYFLLFLIETIKAAEDYDFSFALNESESREEMFLEPIPKWQGHFGEKYNPKKIIRDFSKWRYNSAGQNLWEKSGLFQGDIMLRSENDARKNGISDRNARWPHGTIPYFITDEFTESEKQVIKEAMKEIEEETCIRFREHEPYDRDFVKFQAKKLGCWSFLGRNTGGQILNLNRPQCVQHHIVLHELLHAVGFSHQQCSWDRDRYVRIHWENIDRAEQDNFHKIDKNKMDDYGYGYDYASIMHYGPRAFSKNGGITISPKVSGTKIGQKGHLSIKDVRKVQALYRDICRTRVRVKKDPPNDDWNDEVGQEEEVNAENDAIDGSFQGGQQLLEMGGQGGENEIARRVRRPPGVIGIDDEVPGVIGIDDEVPGVIPLGEPEENGDEWYNYFIRYGRKGFFGGTLPGIRELSQLCGAFSSLLKLGNQNLGTRPKNMNKRKIRENEIERRARRPPGVIGIDDEVPGVIGIDDEVPGVIPLGEQEENGDEWYNYFIRYGRKGFFDGFLPGQRELSQMCGAFLNIVKLGNRRSGTRPKKIRIQDSGENTNEESEEDEDGNY